MLRRVKKSFLFLSSAPVRIRRASVLYAFLLLCTAVFLQPGRALCSEHSAHGEHAAHSEHGEKAVHSEHEKHAAHSEHGKHAVQEEQSEHATHSEHGEKAVHSGDEKHEHGEKAMHSEHEEHEHGEHAAHGSMSLNIIHWCFLFFLMFAAVKSLLSKLVFKEDDETMKSYGALVLMVIFLYAYEQIPGMAHYKDAASWGFLKFILKMFTGICLTIIGIVGMHEHHEDDEHGHSAAHH